MKTVIVKGGAGMGNRMLCAASGILWAKAAKRKVYIDWRDQAYSSNEENSFFHFFENSQILKEAPVCTSNIFPKVWKGNQNYSISKMIGTYDPKKFGSLLIHKKYSINPKNIYYPEDIVVFWHYIGFFEKIKAIVRNTLPEFSKMSLEVMMRKVIVEEMKLLPKIQYLIDNYKKQNFQENMIGVHIRYTDRKINLIKIENAIKKVLNKNKEAMLFLCTDCKDIENTYRRKYGERVFFTEKWFPATDSKRSALHYNNCPDRVQNGVEALIDMYLLSQCNYIIYSENSTFSYISRVISDLPNDKVINIDKFDIKFILKKYIRKLTT